MTSSMFASFHWLEIAVDKINSYYENIIEPFCDPVDLHLAIIVSYSRLINLLIWSLPRFIIG